MKALTTIGSVLLCLLIKSEIISLLFILVALISFIAMIGKENPHDFF